MPERPMPERPMPERPDAEACPVCGKPAGGPRLRPFCSARCADVDLGRWFTGAYAIAAPPPELDDGEAEPP